MSRTTFDPFFTPSLLENSSPARVSHHAISSGVSIVDSGLSVLELVFTNDVEEMGSEVGFVVESVGLGLDSDDDEGRRGNAPNEEDWARR